MGQSQRIQRPAGAWFRVPHFREPTPGGYRWLHALHAGGDATINLNDRDPRPIVIDATTSPGADGRQSTVPWTINARP
ncbi:hypothetical protein V4F39_03380 [Aquincola sp. MAHUQ-54]|uniref:Uncharacterized protein n=1 Tax=Aquincola agrisoli TaxID=3119538 RepID=A0AAW9Q0R2_9BURK